MKVHFVSASALATSLILVFIVKLCYSDGETTTEAPGSLKDAPEKGKEMDKQYSLATKRFGPKFLEVIKCMGTDWLINCKGSIVLCALTINPWLCLPTIYCGNRNIMICIAVANGNKTAEALLTTPGYSLIKHYQQIRDKSRQDSIDKQNEAAVAERKASGKGVEEQDVKLKSSAEEEATDSPDAGLRAEEESTDAPIEMATEMPFKDMIEMQFQAAIKLLGPTFGKVLKCMGKDWALPCKTSVITCALKKQPWSCLPKISCGHQNMLLCVAIAQGNKTAEALFKKRGLERIGLDISSGETATESGAPVDMKLKSEEGGEGGEGGGGERDKAHEEGGEGGGGGEGGEHKGELRKLQEEGEKNIKKIHQNIDKQVKKGVKTLKKIKDKPMEKLRPNRREEGADEESSAGDGEDSLKMGKMGKESKKAMKKLKGSSAKLAKTLMLQQGEE